MKEVRASRSCLRPRIQPFFGSALLALASRSSVQAVCSETAARAFRAYFAASIAGASPLSVFSGPPTQTIFPAASATNVAGMSLTR